MSSRKAQQYISMRRTHISTLRAQSVGPVDACKGCIESGVSVTVN